MERIPKQFYTTEFKVEAVKLVIDGGLKVAEVGRRLNVTPQTLRNWIKRHKDGKPVAGTRTVTALEAEVSRFRGELAEARWRKKS